jgi:type 2 lantibiotic biosynthesis protein LanM
MSAVVEPRSSANDVPQGPWLARIDSVFRTFPPTVALPADASPRVRAGHLLYRHALAQAQQLPMHGLAAAERALLLSALSAQVCRCLDLWLTKVVVYEVNLARDSQRLHGSSGRQRLASFFEQIGEDAAALEFCRRHAVLMCRVLRHFELLNGFIAALAGHLAQDRAALEQDFGALGGLVEAALGRGDSHFGAKQVVVLRFEHGSIVYKPRSLQVDQLFADLVARFNPQLRHALRAPRCLLREGYGWQEFIAPGIAEGREACARFYYSMGAFLALAQLVNATDFHFENILTTSAGEPVLFDLETAFANSYAAGAAGVQRASHDAVQAQLDALNRSVLKSSILPSQGKNAAGMNALTDAEQRDTLVSVDTLVDQDSDTIRLERGTVKMEISSSLPRLDGRRTRPVDFIDDILAGFDAAYGQGLAQRAELQEWINSQSGCRVRCVLRNTLMYGMFMMESTHPLYSGSGERLQQLLGKLGIITEFQPAFRAVLGEEVTQLMQFDIPAFTIALGESTLDGHAQRGLPFHGRSPLDAFAETLASLSPRDKIAQRRWITRSFGLSSYPRPGAQASADAFVQACADYLVDAAHRADSDYSLCWLQVVLPEEGGDARPQLPTLYSGQAGMLLLFAALAAQGGSAAQRDVHQRLRHMLRGDAQNLVSEGQEAGLYQGTAGPLYALLHDALLHGDAALLDFVRAQTHALLSTCVVKGNDVIAGGAGVMLYLCALLRGGGVDATVEAALARLGGQLLAARDADSCSWSSDHGAQLGGFSHGNAGIAHALLSAGELLQRDDFIAAGLAALAFEDSRFDAAQQNWPDVRKATAEVFNNSWCNGAPGYLIPRAIHYARLDADARRCFVLALQRFLAVPAFPDESLCHGTAGGLDVLVTVHRHVPALVSSGDVQRLLRQLIDAAPARAGTQDCDAPGLLTGLAGMAYAVLRAGRPDLPSVLSVYG